MIVRLRQRMRPQQSPVSWVQAISSWREQNKMLWWAWEMWSISPYCTTSHSRTFGNICMTSRKYGRTFSHNCKVDNKKRFWCKGRVRVVPISNNSICQNTVGVLVARSASSCWWTSSYCHPHCTRMYELAIANNFPLPLSLSSQNTIDC